MTSILTKMVAVVPVLALGAAIFTATPAAAHWPENDWRWRQLHHQHHQWQPPYRHWGHYNPPPRPYYPQLVTD